MQTVQTPQTHGAYRWLVIVMLWLVCFFSYADRQAFFSVFPLLQKELSLTTVQLGLLGSSFAIVYGVGAPFAGALVDRMRRKTAILGGLELWSLVCMASALARNFVQLIVFRALQGMGETIYYPAALSMVSDYHGRRTRSRAMGALQTSVYAGTVGGGYWAGTLAQHHGWRAAILLFGSLGSLLGLALIPLLREPLRGMADDGAPQLSAEHPASPLSPRELRSLLKIPSLLLLMGVFACANFVAMVLLTWMPLFLYSRFHLSLGMAAFDAAVYPQIASIGGAFFGGFCADSLAQRTPRGRVLVQCAGVVVAAPFVAWSGLTGSLLTAIVALNCWGFFKGMYDSNIFAAAFDVVPAEVRGVVSGLMNCVGWLIGAGTAPVLIGYLARTMPLGTAIASSSVVYWLAAILLIVTMTFFLNRDVARLRPAAKTQTFAE
jgi:MFS family permease